MTHSSLKPLWTTNDSHELYQLGRWSGGYFGINERGHVTVRPDGDASREVDLHDIVRGLEDRGLTTPVLIRFSDILAHRMAEIHSAFHEAMSQAEYAGGYSCVYPIKVNQQRHVCEEVRDIGSQFGFGLEAGSKPELLAVLALTDGCDDMPIICNGFKDQEYIETVVLATKLGRNIIPVIEKPSELDRVIELARRYDVRPKIGIRAKLSSRGAGRWEGSAGLRSKFGLFVSELLLAVERLDQNDMLDCLTLLHCHIGSQVGDIRHIKNAVGELAHIYSELVALGAPMGILDVGGGLGVDYDGSRSMTDSSMNYTVAEYAADIVWRVKSVCDEKGVAHPMIMTESGRALVAHSSVLVCNVLGRSGFEAPDRTLIDRAIERADTLPQPIQDLIDAYDEIDECVATETYHDAMQAREEAASLFALGYIDLPTRGAAEQLFWSIGRRLVEKFDSDDAELPDELSGLPGLLSDIYFCNLSIFQSVPDSWAIDHLFPVCPIHRLDERPTRHAVLADITCDSDGKMERFVGARGSKRTLELHELEQVSGDGPSSAYYLGIFLVGAYQETLGDLHNLFGDTHAIHLRVGPSDGEWTIEEVVEGDTVHEVLSYVQFDPEQMRRTMRRGVEQATRLGRLTVQEGKSLLQFYEQGLKGYTYLEE